jgi:hypothetical protein
MAVDPSLEEFLLRYPDQLDDAELAALHLRAEGDPELDRLLDALLQAEAALRQELIRAWSTRGVTPTALAPVPSQADLGLPEVGASANSGPVNWSSRGVTPTARTRGAGPRGVVVAALAACVVLFVGLRLRGPAPDTAPFAGDDDLSVRGVGDVPTGALWLLGPARIEPGASRPVTDPLRFHAIVAQESWLLLAELQGGKVAVLHPAPGGEWRVPAGAHLLAPDGSAADYRPGSPGDATYVLLAATGRRPVPQGSFADIPALTSAAVGFVEIARVDVKWSSP